MPSNSQVSSERQQSSPTDFQPTSSFGSLNSTFDAAELATLRVIGLDAEALADVLDVDLREELFEEIARNAVSLSHIPSDERREALLHFWLFKASKRVKDESERLKAQSEGNGTFARMGRDVPAQMNLDDRYHIRRNGDEAFAGLPPIVAAEYRNAIASFDLDSLSPRFTTEGGSNGEYVRLNSVLRRKFALQEAATPEPRKYMFCPLAAICDFIPPIHHWPDYITYAFVARYWKFGRHNGKAVLLLAHGKEDRVIAWIDEELSERFVHNGHTAAR